MANSIEERGRIKEKRDVAQKLVEKKFGLLSAEAGQRLDTLPVERLDEIILAILTAKSLKELGLADEGAAE
jgi:hypothetical protein